MSEWYHSEQIIVNVYYKALIFTKIEGLSRSQKLTFMLIFISPPIKKTATIQQVM